MVLLEFCDALLDDFFQLVAGGKSGLNAVLFGSVRNLLGRASGEDDGNRAILLADERGKPTQDSDLVIWIDLAGGRVFPVEYT